MYSLISQFRKGLNFIELKIPNCPEWLYTYYQLFNLLLLLIAFQCLYTFPLNKELLQFL